MKIFALSWLSVYYVTLVAAVTFLVGLAADAVAIRVFVVEFLALSTIYNFISHNIRCFYFFHARTSRNTRQISRKGRNRGQNARTRRNMLSYSFPLSFLAFVISVVMMVFRNNTALGYLRQTNFNSEPLWYISKIIFHFLSLALLSERQHRTRHI